MSLTKAVFGASLVVGASISETFHNSFGTLDKRIKKLGSSVENANAKIANIKAIKQHGKELERLKLKQKTARDGSFNYGFAILKEAEALAKAKNQARAYKIDLTNLTKAEVKLGSALQQNQNKLDKISKHANKKRELGNKLGASMAKFGALLGGGSLAKTILASAMQEEEQAKFLRSVINAKDGNKDRSIAESLKFAHANARNSLANTSELLNIEYNLNSAGLDEDLSRASTMLIHKVAKVTQGEGEQVAAIMGVTFNNMADSIDGTAQEKMSTIGNVLAKTQFKYQIKDFNQLGEGMKEAAAGASAAKLPFLQTATIIGQLNNAGVQGSSAGTALNATLRSLTKASEELGFEVVRSADGSLDLIKTLEGLDDATSWMSTDEKADALQNMFGDEGKKGVIPLLNNIKNLKTGVKELQEASKTGLVEKEYSQFMQGSLAQFTIFKNNLAQLGTLIGTTLLPPLNGIVSVFNGVFSAVNRVAEAFPVLGIAVGGLAVGFIAVLGASLAATAIQWAYNAAMLANPIVWTIGAIVAGIAVLYLAWQKVKGWFGFGDKEGEQETNNFSKIGEKMQNSQQLDVGAKVDQANANIVQSKNSNATTNNTNNITINQQPGEDAESLAQRVIEQIDYQNHFKQRNLMYDF